MPIASTEAPMTSVEALMAAAGTSVTSVEALTASAEVLAAAAEVLTACTNVAGSSGFFFDFLPLSTSSGLDALSSRGDFLGTISRVLISCFYPELGGNLLKFSVTII